MDKAMAFGFLFLFCVVFLMIEESSGLGHACSSYPNAVPVSKVCVRAKWPIRPELIPVSVA